MTLVGLDPLAGVALARVCDEVAGELEGRDQRVSRLLRAADGLSPLGVPVPMSLRGTAEELREEADDLRRRAGELADNAERLLSEVRSFLGGDVLSLWNGGPAEGMPWGRWLAGASRELQTSVYVLRAILPDTEAVPVPLFNNGLLGRLLTRAPGMAWLGSPAATTVLRGAGIAGGLYTGVTGTIDLIQQGNPIDAYHQKGAGYVADVAGTAFGYSSAAFLAAPNPVTGGLVIGTGAIWLGAEAWDHRDDIAAAWGSASQWTSDRLGDAGDWAGDRLNGLSGAADSLLHGVPGIGW